MFLIRINHKRENHNNAKIAKWSLVKRYVCLCCPYGSDFCVKPKCDISDSFNTKINLLMM